MFLKFSDYLKPINAIQKAYRGIVVNNQDPEQIGRIQVNIPDFIEGTLQSDGTWNLPWIYQKAPAMLGGNGVSSSFAVPEVNSEVFVEFPYGDIYSGFYSYYWQSETTHQTFLNEDYPNSYGFSDSTGTQFKIDKAKLFLEFIHASGAYFYIDDQSNITLQTNSQIIFTSSDQQNQIIFDLTTGAITNSANADLNVTAASQTNNVYVQNDNFGTHNDSVSGARTTNISGGLSTSVGGDIAEAALGNKVYVAAGNKSTLIAGATTETFGQSKSETVVLGNWVVSVQAGNITVSTLAGSTEIGNEIASFEVSATGEITASNAIGSFTIDPTGNITLENDLATLAMSSTGDIKVSNEATGELHINSAGQVALGSEVAELLNLMGQFINTLITNAANFVFTGVGPGALSPTILASLTEIQGLLTSITGTL